MPFLELRNVRKGYGANGSRSEVLCDINLQIEKGEFVAIVGYSGAGKTTLISLIAGLMKPDTGSLTLNDLEIREPGPDREIVFQNYSLLPWLTVYENVFLAVDQVNPNWALAKKQEHVEKYIAMVPQILLLDEPLSALDALTRATLQDEISRIWQQERKTVVLITNDVDEGILLADRIIPLSAGPNATLGPSFAIDLPRPRDRKAINHVPAYKQV